MDGRNSFGRRISLLNDDVPTVTRKLASAKFSPSFSASSSASSSRLPSFVHSRAPSSAASTPCLSPQTPPLIRSNSLDSSDMDVPSPITPEYQVEGVEALPGIALQATSQLYPQPHSAYFVPTKDATSVYPPLPSHTIPLPYNTSLPYAPLPQNPSATFDLHAAKSPVAAQAAPQPQQQSDLSSRQVPQANRTKKGQHPCPLAKQYNCSDTFTTSGHASRHAKKHTGEKSAICPDCGKDFTRKDNMEQHRKTHLSGRNANKSRNVDPKTGTSRQQATSKRPKPSPLQSSSGLVQADSSSTLSVGPPTPLTLQQQLPEFVAPSQEAVPLTAYPDPASCGGSLVYPGVPHDALHTLASAASGRFVG